jgi:hypothetical protein
MPDRVALVLTVWLALWTTVGLALGAFVFGTPGTAAVSGFFVAVATTLLWPWIMPRPIDRWMDAGGPADDNRLDSWIDHGRSVVPSMRGWIDRSRASLSEVRRLIHHDRHMDGGAAA